MATYNCERLKEMLNADFPEEGEVQLNYEGIHLSEPAEGFTDIGRNSVIQTGTLNVSREVAFLEIQ